VVRKNASPFCDPLSDCFIQSLERTMKPSLPVAVVGAGPAGLMAAQVLADAGHEVHVFDAMPSIGRKFLLAGKGGLNLTHSEGADTFAGRYGARRNAIEGLLKGFDITVLRQWARNLGIETFVGTSGRVFPTDMKAAPLLRAWLHRLRHPESGQPVQFHMRHRWTGWSEDNGLVFETLQGTGSFPAKAVVLALGGGSWSRLGSNGAWVPMLAQKGVAVAPLRPSNCGFDVQGGWSVHFRDRFAGQPFKSVAISVALPNGVPWKRKGEFVATDWGVEGSLVYAASSVLREEIVRTGSATFELDLLPDMTPERVLQEVSHPRGSRSLSSHLKSRLNLDGIKAAMLYEVMDHADIKKPAQLAAAIKALPVHLESARPIDEAISSAGGVLFEVLSPGLMLEQLPGVFCAGEMLDWEAPTGGYLLHACFATGRAAGQGACDWLARFA
jgi:uncharacterized flavoprotein (TIGR03862 family)